ncbi:MAG: redox-sensing transcriptional repressor Rex [Clostridia bacterium]|nr:redox-sensing transcriptional repressor Rex [Clostridia bacterium]MDD7701014.1 redox-sensing transcriptional repressor Rex [Eubacteriales bacterium]MDY2827499.1 redox-sensing transcriptional repressor Rex [Eubacteriales bacterium]
MSKEEKNARGEVSPAVIRRLPRYFRYLRVLIRAGKTRVSSGELSAMMHVTASQIRQDLNCFGGFGQQGYGYNVGYLYEKICEILGVNEGYHAIIIGAGNLGRALVRNPMFTKRGVKVVGMFDVDEAQIGRMIAGVEVYDSQDLSAFCRENRVDIAVLTLPKENAADAAKELTELGVPALWNFTGKELDRLYPQSVVENVHIGDSLMTLCYELRTKEKTAREAEF